MSFFDEKIAHPSGIFTTSIYSKPIFRGVFTSLKVNYIQVINTALFLLYFAKYFPSDQASINLMKKLSHLRKSRELQMLLIMVNTVGAPKHEYIIFNPFTPRPFQNCTFKIAFF